MGHLQMLFWGEYTVDINLFKVDVTEWKVILPRVFFVCHQGGYPQHLFFCVGSNKLSVCRWQAFPAYSNVTLADWTNL
jgi:hypothetical protein